MHDDAGINLDLHEIGSTGRGKWVSGDSGTGAERNHGPAEIALLQEANAI